MLEKNTKELINDMDHLCHHYYSEFLDGEISISTLLYKALCNYIDELFQLEQHETITFNHLQTILLKLILHINHKFQTRWFLSDPDLLIQRIIDYCIKTYFYTIIDERFPPDPEPLSNTHCPVQ